MNFNKIFELAEKDPEKKEVYESLKDYEAFFRNISDPTTLKQVQEMFLRSIDDKPKIRQGLRQLILKDLQKLHVEATEGMIYNEKNDQYVKKDYLKSGEYLN